MSQPTNREDTMDDKLYQRDPRSYALGMVEDGLVTAQAMLEAMLVSMSHDDVREALDANELSPRFNEDADDEEGA